MKKPLRNLLFAWFALLGLTAQAADPQKLNLFIWSEYIDPKIITQFEAANHCKVVIDL